MTSDPQALVDGLFARWAREDGPGAVVAVTRNGRELLRACYGMADIAQGVLLNPRSVIRIGSQTKQFTVLLALMLEAEGRLSLEDDFRAHLPWVPDYGAKLTLRHFASNTSGIRDHLEALTYSGRSMFAPSSAATVRALVARQDALNFAPGTAMMYSNAGFLLLSDVLEKVTGQSWAALLEERITGPLGMRDTRLLAWDDDIEPRLVAHHTRGADGRWQRAHWGMPLSGEGGMISTLEDMLTWQANLVHPRVGTPEMFARMIAPAVFANGTVSRYGLGLTSGAYRGVPSFGHGGGVAGGRSESQYYPDQALGIVILGNSDEIAPHSLARRTADGLLGDALAGSGPLENAGALAGAAGLYRHDGGDDLFEIVVKDGAPQIVTSMGGAPLQSDGRGGFIPERPTTHLTLTPAGTDTIDVLWSGQPRRYRRVEPGQVAPRCEIVGAWRNATGGLEAEITPEPGGHRLLLRSEFGALRLGLRHLDGDLYIARPGTAQEGHWAALPWTCTVLAGPEAIAISSDRTKGLRLTRAG